MWSMKKTKLECLESNNPKYKTGEFYNYDNLFDYYLNASSACLEAQGEEIILTTISFKTKFKINISELVKYLICSMNCPEYKRNKVIE